VYTRGVDGRRIFRDDWDYIALLAGLGQLPERHGWKVLLYCVLGTHYHVLLKTPRADLPEGMRRVNLGYARWFNKRYGTRGHVFDGRYGARLIVDQGHALEAIRYIALNANEAGLCRSAEEWQWSSYPGAVGRGDLPPFVDLAELLSNFGGDAAASARLRAFVDDGLARRTG
jgi:putative transposase